MGAFDENLRHIIDAIPGFVWFASPDGSIVYLNQRGLDYTGFTLEQIAGWTWKDTNILHPDDIGVSRRLQNAFENIRYEQTDSNSLADDYSADGKRLDDRAFFPIA